MKLLYKKHGIFIFDESVSFSCIADSSRLREDDIKDMEDSLDFVLKMANVTVPETIKEIKDVDKRIVEKVILGTCGSVYLDKHNDLMCKIAVVPRRIDDMMTLDDVIVTHFLLAMLERTKDFHSEIFALVGRLTSIILCTDISCVESDLTSDEVLVLVKMIKRQDAKFENILYSDKCTTITDRKVAFDVVTVEEGYTLDSEDRALVNEILVDTLVPLHSMSDHNKIRKVLDLVVSKSKFHLGTSYDGSRRRYIMNGSMVTASSWSIGSNAVALLNIVLAVNIYNTEIDNFSERFRRLIYGKEPYEFYTIDYLDDVRINVWISDFFSASYVEEKRNKFESKDGGEE